MGRAWQDAIAAENVLLHARNRAHVFEVPAPFARVGAKKGSKLYRLVGELMRINPRYLIARKEAPVAADYAGTLRGGRGVFFEAKSVEHDTRFEFRNITDEQRRELAAHAELGSLVFVYVERRDALRRIAYMLPVEPGTSRNKPGVIAGEHEKASIPWSSAEPWRLKPSETWYEAALRLDLHMEPY